MCVFVSVSLHGKWCLTPGLSQPWTTGRGRRPSAGRGSMLALGSLLGPLPWACVSDSISVQYGSWHSGLGDRKLNWGLNYKRQSLYDHRRLRTGRELWAYLIYNNSELGFIEHLLYGRHCTKWFSYIIIYLILVIILQTKQYFTHLHMYHIHVKGLACITSFNLYYCQEGWWY